MPTMRADLSEDELQELYTWVDEIPLSRPKRNISRDFSDAVLLAEIISHYYPKLVELHNYSAANGMAQKMYNWNTLNQKVLKRLHYQIPRSDCEKCANATPGAVEKVLLQIKSLISRGPPKKKTPKKAPVPSPGGLPYPSPGGYPSPPRHQSQPQGLPFQQHPSPPQPAPASHGFAHHPAKQQQQPFDDYVGVAHQSGGSQDMAAAQRALAEKDQSISELRETNEILETKVRKLEQLVRLKDAKIQTLLSKLQAPGVQ